jgi:hypothetical protein
VIGFSRCGGTLLAFAASVFLSGGCASLEGTDQAYTKTDALIRHAKRYQAERLGLPSFEKAEALYLRAKELYRNEYYKEANATFLEAQRYAEIALRKAYLIKASRGSLFQGPPASEPLKSKREDKAKKDEEGDKEEAP